MAESLSRGSWIVNVPCRYYANGICREGERCKYLHQEGLGWTSSTSGEDGVRDLTENTSGSINGSNTNVTSNSPSSSSRSRSSSSSSSSSGSINGKSTSNISSSDINSIENSSCTSNISDMDGCHNTSSETSSDSKSNAGGISEINPSMVSPSVCRFFQRGCCHYGDMCHFSHAITTSADCTAPAHGDGSSLDKTTSIHTSAQDRPSSSASSSASSTSTSTAVRDTDESSNDKRMEENRPKTSLRVPDAETWVNAPEFVPSFMASVASVEQTSDPATSSGKTWAQVVNATAGIGSSEDKAGTGDNTKLCPYAEMNGECPYAERCSYLHGDTCDLCGAACLHPTDDEQRKLHTNECIEQHERNMELSFAVARSRDKQCGVCFEVVMEKNPPREQRFGILPNCNHCFCLACIRKWRQAKQFENKIIRACPECRVTSDYVCPSMYWVDTKEEKEKLIMNYKEALSNKQCKYFKQGSGKCPFGNKCFYLHAYPDGTKVDTGPPIRRHRQNADGDIDVLQQLFLWDFLEDRDNRWLYNLEELEDLVALFTDSEDSELSDFEFF